MTIEVALFPPCLRGALESGAPANEVAEAVCEYPSGAIEVAVTSATETGWVDGVFGPAGYVLAASDDPLALMTGIVQSLPLQIARLVALGPRPLAPDAEIALGRFASVSQARTARTLPDAVASALTAPDAVHWSVRARWAAPDGPSFREVEVVDGGDGGLVLWLPLPETDEVALMPCSSSDVWRLLCALLPYPSEVL